MTTRSASSSGSVKVGIKVDGLNETLRAFNTYGKEANKELRQAAGGHVDALVPVIMVAAGVAGPQATLAATSVKRVSDRVPAIGAGGSRKVKPSGKRKVTASDVFFGAEFGGGRRPTTRQFPPYTGRNGIWFFPTIRAATPALVAAYKRTLEELAEKWGRGGNE